MWPQSLCLSRPAISSTFPIINRLLIFQQSTEEHTLTKESVVTLNLILAIVYEFKSGTVLEMTLEYLD